LLVCNDEPSLSLAINLEHLDDWSTSLNSNLDDLAIDIFCVLSGFLEETLVADDGKICFTCAWRRIDKIALVDEVAAQLLVRISR
jgi:hypothetical protein